MGAAAVPIFMIATAAASAGVAMEQSTRQNRAARKTAESARATARQKSEWLKERQAILQRGIASKSDQQRLQVARQAAIERGSRIAASAAKGTTAFAGTEMRNLLDLDARRDALQSQISSNFAIDMKTLQSQTQSGLVDNEAALRQTLVQASAMEQNTFLATLAGAIGGAATGINIGSGFSTPAPGTTPTVPNMGPPTAEGQYGY